MKLRDLFKRTPPSPEKVEQQNKEKQAYRESYNRSRIEGERRRGHREGLARSQRKSGGHGIMATLGTVGKGLGQVGDYGQQMQDNLANMLGSGYSTSPKQKKRKQK